VAGGSLDVQLLGPVEVRVDGRDVALAGRRPRALMTALALRAETAVSRDELIDALWGCDPPLSAVKLLQVQVSQLRRALRVEGEDARVVTRPAGYELRLDSEHVDVVARDSCSIMLGSSSPMG